MQSIAVQASIAANTWVVSGSPQTKSKFIYTSLSSFLFAVVTSDLVYAVCVCVLLSLNIFRDHSPVSYANVCSGRLSQSTRIAGVNCLMGMDILIECLSHEMSRFVILNWSIHNIIFLYF